MLLSCLGGFAHVYLVRSTSPIPPESEQTLHVLKRLAVPDKVQLQFVRKEVDIMVSCVLSVHYRIVSCALALDRKLSAGTSISSISLKLQPRNCQTRAVMKSLFLWSMRLVSLRLAVRAICADESYAGGGIIDMMNTRLQNRLTESEILKIFSDTVEVCLSFAPSLLS